jgi:hypothetical protein
MDASLRRAMAAVICLGAAACAEGAVEFQGEGGGSTTGQAGSPATGGQGGGGGGDGGGVPLPCGIDCTAIMAPTCLKSVCNEGQYPGTVGSCVVVNDDLGVACDDGLFCTANDTCDGRGQCTAGPPNDCGMDPDQCQEVQCNEASQSCTFVPTMNGGFCTPTDLCLVNATCLNGSCSGGQPKDCFFAPVPNECHTAECNPMNGLCEPHPDPTKQGMTCTDMADLCTVNKTCDGAGNCQGGQPKDCSAFTQGCNLGTCNMMTGQCFGMPINDGDPCDDLDSCTSGEICQMGSCAGGMVISQCVGNDGCCPQGCTEVTDSDCSCNVNLALQATPSSSGGGQNASGYGPSNWNDGVTEQECQMMLGCTQCQGWISNGTSPSGAFMQYDWPSPVQIGSMYVDASDCVGTCYQGRTLAGGTIQWWDGLQWVNEQGFAANPGDLAITFNPKITTSKLRMFDVVAGNCGQNNNTLAYEWYVYPGSNCTP